MASQAGKTIHPEVIARLDTELPKLVQLKQVRLISYSWMVNLAHPSI